MPSNEDRADWALKGVLAFAEETGQGHDGVLDNANEEEAITDLLCNLHHLADELGLKWENLLRSGDMHYTAEVDEADDEEDEDEDEEPQDVIASL